MSVVFILGATVPGGFRPRTPSGKGGSAAAAPRLPRSAARPLGRPPPPPFPGPTLGLCPTHAMSSLALLVVIGFRSRLIEKIFSKHLNMHFH